MSTDFTITKGLPFARVVTLVSGKNVWPNLTDFEIRSQLRQKATADSPLIADLHEFMTAEYGVGAAANDIVITWSMTGAETRALPSKGKYDIVLSDVGAEDARAVPILDGSIFLKVLTTAPED